MVAIRDSPNGTARYAAAPPLPPVLYTNLGQNKTLHDTKFRNWKALHSLWVHQGNSSPRNEQLSSEKILVANLMFCWKCITAHQYSETNVMHFVFSLLRINGLYMFQALLAHPQVALDKRHLEYCVRVMSVGCTRLKPTDITRTQYTKCRLCSASWEWASNARNM
jgi:hypothetical protein